jgi:hypothetical protein
MEKDFRNDEYDQEIARLAYSYWEDRGYENGHDVEDWLKAEQEVERRSAKRPDEQRRHVRTAA